MIIQPAPTRAGLRQSPGVLPAARRPFEQPATVNRGEGGFVVDNARLDIEETTGVVTPSGKSPGQEIRGQALRIGDGLKIILARRAAPPTVLFPDSHAAIGSQASASAPTSAGRG